MTGLKTPAGKPASVQRRTSSAAMTGVLFEGFSNKVLPPTTAAVAMPVRMASGK